MKILVAVDESEESMHALMWTIDHHLVSANEIDSLVVLHVQKPLELYAYPIGPAVYASAVVIDSVKKAQQQDSEELLIRVKEICRNKRIESHTVIIDGDPKEIICQTIDQMNIDLVVLGSRGQGMIKRALLGSVSDYCAHHANCPVLIVRPRKEQEQRS
ncbi:Universal stress protein family protein [Zostera marina]|uniref:Universal stress protein family protein n=1 Tax=Zostera marina TaxID=29655 RepID=A0A0K9Q488_ZOSMR|nr:Universal stress protein family protein [Zostera marina]